MELETAYTTSGSSTDIKYMLLWITYAREQEKRENNFIKSKCNSMLGFSFAGVLKVKVIINLHVIKPILYLAAFS